MGSVEQCERVEQPATVDRDDAIEGSVYQGLTFTSVTVYLVRSQARNHAPYTDIRQAILAVGFAEMMVLISSGSVRQSRVEVNFSWHLHPC